MSNITEISNVDFIIEISNIALYLSCAQASDNNYVLNDKVIKNIFLNNSIDNKKYTHYLEKLKPLLPGIIPQKYLNDQLYILILLSHYLWDVKNKLFDIVDSNNITKIKSMISELQCIKKLMYQDLNEIKSKENSIYKIIPKQIIPEPKKNSKSLYMNIITYKNSAPDNLINKIKEKCKKYHSQKTKKNTLKIDPTKSIIIIDNEEIPIKDLRKYVKVHYCTKIISVIQKHITHTDKSQQTELPSNLQSYIKAYILNLLFNVIYSNLANTEQDEMFKIFFVKDGLNFYFNHNSNTLSELNNHLTKQYTTKSKHKISNSFSDSEHIDSGYDDEKSSNSSSSSDDEKPSKRKISSTSSESDKSSNDSDYYNHPSSDNSDCDSSQKKEKNKISSHQISENIHGTEYDDEKIERYMIQYLNGIKKTENYIIQYLNDINKNEFKKNQNIRTYEITEAQDIITYKVKIDQNIIIYEVKKDRNIRTNEVKIDRNIKTYTILFIEILLMLSLGIIIIFSTSPKTKVFQNVELNHIELFSITGLILLCFSITLLCISRISSEIFIPQINVPEDIQTTILSTHL